MAKFYINMGRAFVNLEAARKDCQHQDFGVLEVEHSGFTTTPGTFLSAKYVPLETVKYFRVFSDGLQGLASFLEPPKRYEDIGYNKLVFIDGKLSSVTYYPYDK